MKGFDISYWQGDHSVSDFKKAKEKKWEFVFIRISYNCPASPDSKFEKNYSAAIKAGMKVGVYHYSKATSIAKAKSEAQSVLSILKKRKLQCPVFFDCEDSVQKRLGKSRLKKICEEFCRIVEENGYQAGVYSSYDFLTNKIDKISDKYMIWLAQYPKATYKGRYEIHQYSSSGSVPGFGDSIDVDKSDKLKFGDYPVNKKTTSKKKETKKTTSKKTTSKKTKSSSKKKEVTESIIKAVIDGKYGNGDDRKKNLEKDGYDYKKVQDAVTLRVVAQDVISGKYGNGLIRKLRLKRKGYDPEKIQKEVIKLLNKKK